MNIRDNFAKHVLDAGGSIHPLIIPSSDTDGTGLMNPSIYRHNNKLCLILRHVNYTFYHSESKLFQHPWGPLTYVHPEHDMHLRTINYYCELDKSLNITRHTKIDTSKFDTYEPKWDFVGLEDARIFEWDGHLYTCGVRRDTTPNGQGRMELCEIEVKPNAVTEVSRWRIPTPNNVDTYCEKNWMPIQTMPYHFVKWSNPVEVVKVDPANNKTETVFMGDTTHPISSDPRGGSQVIPWEYQGEQYWLALTHEVHLFKSEVGRKDAIYRHRFMLWDKSWNLAGFSPDFSIMNAHVEFAVGMCEHDDGDILISFGYQDNGAYILKTPKHMIDRMIDEE